MKNLKKLFKNKKLKYGGMSIILTAVFIAIVIVFNFVVGLLLERFDVHIDITADRLFSIDDETRDYLAGLTDRVTITVASRESDFTDPPHPSLGPIYNQLNEILKRFAGVTPNITLNYVDLMTNPDFAARFDNLEWGTIVFESQNTERHRVLRAEDYLVINAQTGEVGASGEGAFLTAILSVTDINPIHVGIITGQGEYRNSILESLLLRNAYHIHEINLVTADLNNLEEELDFILINSPTADYTTESISKLNSWLDNNGQFGKTLLYIAPVSAETPRMDSFLRDWGINVERAYVFQLDNRFASHTPQLQVRIQYYIPLDYDRGLNPSYEIYGELIRHVEQVFEERSNIKTRPLLVSYDGAVIMPFTAFDEDSEWSHQTAEKGAYNVAVHSYKTRFEGESWDAFEVHSNLIVFGGGSDTMMGNGDVFNENFLMMQNANNAEFFINMMNDISGKEAVIVIAPKSFSVPSFEISQNQSEVIGAIFIFILPIGVIVAGFVIWIRRIRK